MGNIVKANAKDGSTVEFVYKDPKQGGVKDVYFSPDKSYVVAFFRKGLNASEKDRIENIVGTYREKIFNQKGGEYWKSRFCWPEKIVEYNGMIGLKVPTYNSKFFFKGGNLDGAEKEGKWFASAKNYNRFLPENEKGELITYLKICLELSRATRRLHAAGLAHSDLSYKNCLVDPKTGSACIIDIDGLVVPGLYPPDVLGTPDFIAPEVVATMHLPMGDPKRKLPRRETDLHALAVLNYLYLFHRHPLRGGQVHDTDDAVQEKMEMGEKALFIEHPTDKRNRPKFDKNDKVCFPWIDPSQIPYTTAGPYLKELFDRAFIDGLHNPSARPSADDWEVALVKTTDLLQPCSNPKCPKKFYVFDNTTKPVCPYCGTPFKGLLPVIDFYSSRDGKSFRPDNTRLMVFTGQSLYKWHTHRNIFPNEKLTEEQKERVGYFSFYNGRWILVNQKLPTMKNLTTGEDIPVGQGVELTNGLQIQFSSEPSGRVASVQIVQC